MKNIKVGLGLRKIEDFFLMFARKSLFMDLGGWVDGGQNSRPHPTSNLLKLDDLLPWLYKHQVEHTRKTAVKEDL